MRSALRQVKDFIINHIKSPGVVWFCGALGRVCKLGERVPILFRLFEAMWLTSYSVKRNRKPVPATSLERRGYEPKLEGHGAHISENKLSFWGFQPNTVCFLLQKGTIERHFWNTLFCPKFTHKIEWLGILLWEAILYLARFLGQGCSSDPVITQAMGLLIGM